MTAPVSKTIYVTRTGLPLSFQFDWPFRPATSGADAHIDALAKKYKGLDRYDGPSNEQRMLYRIKISHVYVHG